MQISQILTGKNMLESQDKETMSGHRIRRRQLFRSESKPKLSFYMIPSRVSQ